MYLNTLKENGEQGEGIGHEYTKEWMNGWMDECLNYVFD